MKNNILVEQNFYKSIPESRRYVVLEKTQNLINELIEGEYDLNKISKSYYIREIKGRKKKGKIFKFRVSHGERVIFTYGSECCGFERIEKVDIVLLRYETHDRQILEGRKFDLATSKYSKGNIIYDEKEEENLDNEIDNKYKNYNLDLNKYISRIVSIDELIKIGNEKAVYYLSDEQFSCLDPKLDPLFIKGGAGTGKTTIGINKLYSLCNQYEKIGYFTYSKYLKDEVKQHFENLCNQLSGVDKFKNNVEFNSINEFLFTTTYKRELRINELITFIKFKNWYYEKINRLGKFSKIKIELFDIWKEIRGVIKGIVGKNWSGGEFDLENKISKEAIDILLSEKCIEVSKNKKYIFKMNYADILRITSKKVKKEEIRYEIDSLDTIMLEYIAVNEMISISEYLELSNDFSIYSIDERKLIYEIAEKYQKYINENGYVDENDIARKVLYGIAKGNIKKYDYIMLDEVQDLTEIQLYTLYRLSKSEKSFYMNGDLNQTINPTLFRINRIQSLFKSFNKDIIFNERSMTTNYRNSSEIINFTNKIIELRNQFFAENESKIIGIRKSEDKPILLRKNKNNRDELFKFALERAYVAIIVPDEEEKEKLNLILEENLDKEEIKGAVLTVNEIKGLEREYVICYNIISKFKNEWNEMIKKIDISKSKDINISRFKFYFNILYVAITRAQDNICFYEDEEDLEFYEKLKNYITYIEQFDLIDVRLDKESNSDEYLKVAEDFERQENYDGAIRNYRMSKTQKGKISELRCKGKKLVSEGKIIDAIGYFEKANEYYLIAECYVSLEKIELAAEYYYKAESYNKSLELYKKLKNNEMIEVILNKLIVNECKEVTEKFQNIVTKIDKIGRVAGTGDTTSSAVKTVSNKSLIDDYMADFANDEKFDSADESKQGFSGVDFNIYDDIDIVSTTTVNVPNINEELIKVFGEGYSDEMVEVDQEAIDDFNSFDWSVFDNM